MLRFEQGNVLFNCRSVAVIIREDQVLLHRLAGDLFWTLPGGKVEFFENADATLKRELREELGLKAEILRHLWFVENFFEYSGKKVHEISNYFLVQLHAAETLPLDHVIPGIEDDVDLEFRWFPLGQVSELDLKPQFLRNALLNIPTESQYLKVSELTDREWFYNHC